MGHHEIESRLIDAIELVSHETRARILVSLAAQHRKAPWNPTLRFSELRARVGHVDPGNFNYHLTQLTDRLVTQTEAGYQLSTVGYRFVGVLLSGQFDPELELDLSDIEVDCFFCGTPAVVSYADGTLRIDCENDHSFRPDTGPNIVTDHPVEETVDVMMLASLVDMRLILNGVCPTCHGQTSGGLELFEDNNSPIAYRATCDRCGLFYQNTVGGCVLDHPAVVSLCYEHGLDIRTDAREILREHVQTPDLLNDDPLYVEVEISIDDDTVMLGLDETATVVCH